jgi:hypothetical protein
MADELTAAGLSIDDFETRLDDLLAQVRAEISSIIDGSADSPEGQFIRIFVERVQAVAELLQGIHGAQYPDGAIGFSLTALSRLTGTERRAATNSVAYCRVNVDAGTYLAGTLVAHVSGDPTARFVNAVDVTNAGPGAADVDDVLFEAEATGPVVALSGTLTVIAEPVTGWNSVTNAPPGGQGDAVEGQDEETDAELRQRRQLELQTGSTATGAILTALSQVEGVLWVNVLENDQDDYDPNGLPPHAIEAVVHAPTVTDATLAPLLLEAKAAGIHAHGDTYTTVEDDAGEDHQIGITRASVVDVYLEVDVDVDGETYGGDSALALAVANWGDANLGVSEDVVLTQIVAAIFAGVTGIVDVTEIRIGTAPSPVSTDNLPIAWNQLGDLDTGRIVVASTEVS